VNGIVPASIIAWNGWDVRVHCGASNGTQRAGGVLRQLGACTSAVWPCGQGLKA
jgi:hypothetical protein